MNYINSKFPSVEYDDLKKIDKKAIAILDSLAIPNTLVKIPMASAIDLDKQKDFTISLEQLIRVQYAIYNISNIVFITKSETDADKKAYNTYYLKVVEYDEDLEKLFDKARASDKKRESSLTTEEKKANKQKKLEEACTEQKKACFEDFKAKSLNGESVSPYEYAKKSCLLNLKACLAFKAEKEAEVENILSSLVSQIVSIYSQSDYYGFQAEKEEAEAKKAEAEAKKAKAKK